MISFFFYRLRRKIQSLASTSRLLVFSFAAAILLDAFLLTSPLMVPAEGPPNSFMDALFTATSAVCVTGLIVRDTGGEYNLAGQIIILILIQIGALGILTFSNLMVLARQGRIGFKERQILHQTHGILPSVTPAQLLRQIIFYTFLFEAAGAALLTWRFCLDPERSFGQALWLGVFHSVSAFCNAGFSLFSDSFIQYQDDAVMNAVLAGLIICGGLGWIVFADLSVFVRGFIRKTRTRLSLHSKVVLAVSGVLILSGAVLVSLLEIGGEAMPDSFGKHILAGLFLSITSRTAGFNTVDTPQLTNATLLIVLGLMMIGGSPGSTAGGVKTTTFGALAAYFLSRLRNRPQPEMFRRSIPTQVVTKAMLSVVGFITVAIAAVILLQITELGGAPHALYRGSFLDYLFEVVSALGTVGLSTGVTPDLSGSGRLVIIVCMFVGRLGPPIVANSLIGTRRRIEYHYPQGKIIVG